MGRNIVEKLNGIRKIAAIDSRPKNNTDVQIATIRAPVGVSVLRQRDHTTGLDHFGGIRVCVGIEPFCRICGMRQLLCRERRQEKCEQRMQPPPDQ